jgi:tRNA pseudouridine38-40 synthase
MPDFAGRTTYRLDLEYDGTDFAGWQWQPEKRTVQGCLEYAVEVLFQERATVLSAGRTDAGVHATGQVAHVRTASYREPRAVLFGLNSNLPPDVRIQSATVVDRFFHARHSAMWRGYVYRIAPRPLAVGRAYCWQCSFPLNLDTMREAAPHLLGSHSFRAFAHATAKESHYLSDVYRVDWIEREPFVELHIEANRFLHGMVRLLVGTFVAIGRAKMEPRAMAEIIASQDIRQSGQKAPASGLTLVKVGYHDWPEM